MLERAEAEQKAQALIERLGSKAERLEIAGSIRRGKAQVRDIELVAIPKLETSQYDLFGGEREKNALLAELDIMRAFGEVRVDPLEGAWGTKYRRFQWQGAPVDLFLATPENWGLIFMLRTGPSSWSAKLVTSKLDGGFLPLRWRVERARLWNPEGCALETPEEQDVFDALKLTVTAPADRR